MRLWSAVVVFATLFLLLVATAYMLANRDDFGGAQGGSMGISKHAAARLSRMPGQDASELVTETSADRTLLKTLTAEEAQAANARIPLAANVGPAARPMMVSLDNGGQDYLHALDCLATAIYYEAASEPVDGQRAVAQVVLNRVRHLAYPHSICGVVFQGAEKKTGCQFSFTCDGSLARRPTPNGWSLARRIAAAAISGHVYAPVGLSTHYHADYVLPYWAPTLVKQMVVGRHIFYRWPGAWGKPTSFAAQYAGGEPDLRNGGLLAALGPSDEDPTAMQTPPSTLMAGQNNAQGGRPVIIAGKDAATVPTAGQEGRIYLMDKAPERKTMGGGVTGAVIMAGQPPKPQDTAAENRAAEHRD